MWALHAPDLPAAMGTVGAGMSDVANSVTKFIKSVGGPWLSPCQKISPDTGLKLALPVPECLASKTLFHTWCEAAFRRSKAALATSAWKKEGDVSINHDRSH
jgi:hypothetical protein